MYPSGALDRGRLTVHSVIYQGNTAKLCSSYVLIGKHSGHIRPSRIEAKEFSLISVRWLRRDGVTGAKPRAREFERSLNIALPFGLWSVMRVVARMDMAKVRRVLVAERGRIKLIDAGAQTLDAQVDSGDASRAGSVRGTG